MASITKADALKLSEMGWWKGLPARDIVRFQLFEPLLCMDFGDFHEAITEALGRSVWTHEFGLNPEDLKREFLGEDEPPTFAEIIDLIPKEKRILLFGGTDTTDGSPEDD